MGLDFIRTAAPGFNRVLDRRLVELNSPTLFSRDVPVFSRTARADMRDDVAVTLGEKVMLRVINNKVIVQRLNAVIAECPNAPAELVAILRSGAGIAEGEITSVQPISQTLEVGICE
ncbi:hypothetical protein [Bradyrhizobium canariense]|jgi:hypothetical protein|uniref:Uncharacterized protein n=1 Tax=Bradyrhizobium canariense TaxID=255045 RepID=A0A1H2A8X0_9BRAD|nr:hypothetical protein [Bradyrhizobium canariense]SDT42304.1 hypothetical protein SAMN05444158_5971 [Bradyrhizobium canariense]